MRNGFACAAVHVRIHSIHGFGPADWSRAGERCAPHPVSRLVGRYTHIVVGLLGGGAEGPDAFGSESGVGNTPRGGRQQ